MTSTSKVNIDSYVAAFNVEFAELIVKNSTEYTVES